VEVNTLTSRFFATLFTRITAWFANAANGIGDFFAQRVHTKEICDGATCVTVQQIAAMVASASNSAAGISAPANDNYPDASSTATLIVNCNNPSEWQLNQAWNDNLGALFTHDGIAETIPNLPDQPLRHLRSLSAQRRDAPNPSHARTSPTAAAIQLAHVGIVRPLSVISHPIAARASCSNPIRAKIAAANRA
jgi:hypothetical protein